ncbi:MAG: DUF3445 domain-containing protein [Pelagimonas sp.]|jgi:hypothetical protein|nr:DUF3445 domain-containing protein [Pelagimonas sp.]
MVFQSAIPYDVSPRKLPGIQPLALQDWLMVDDAYGGQMAVRRALLQTRRQDVLRLSDPARPAARELLQHVADHLPRGFVRDANQVTCPDGAVISWNEEDPLGTLGQILQEDFCILEKPPGTDEHVLTGAVLCFPASWRLEEKLLRPLTEIHVPVAEYTADIARRVQRLFDGVQVGRGLWRHNCLIYDDPALFQPRSATDPRAPVPSEQGRYLRSERQSILRLPTSRAVIFSIHTFVLDRQT